MVDGEAPWVTSWGLADRFAVAARLGGDVVFFLLDGASPPPGVVASAPLALAAMNASSTVRLRFDGVAVADDDVISVQPYATWRAADRLTAARPRPPVFGVARTCCRLLGDPALDAELDDCRSQRLRPPRRGTAWDMTSTTSTWPPWSGPGRGAASWPCGRRRPWWWRVAAGRSCAPNPAQRLLREAAFFTIQAQTADLRAATLARLQARS